MTPNATVRTNPLVSERITRLKQQRPVCCAPNLKPRNSAVRLPQSAKHVERMRRRMVDGNAAG